MEELTDFFFQINPNTFKEISYKTNNKKYNIQLKVDSEKLYISILKNNFSSYENSFSNNDFIKYKMFKTNISIHKVLNIIYNLFQNKRIKLEENIIKKNIQLILLNNNDDEVIKLNLIKKEFDIDEIIDYIDKLNQKIEENYNKIEKITNKFFLIILIILFLFLFIFYCYNNSKYIKTFHKFNRMIMNEKDNIIKMNERIDNIEKDNLIKINERIKDLEKNNNNKRINERISILESFKVQLAKTNLKNINKIIKHKDKVRSVKTFPSGNIVSVSTDKSIIIYDNNFNVLQILSNAHDGDINYIDVKDDNNFVTCSIDKSIKTWIKKGNKYESFINITNSEEVRQVIYNSKGNLISCSYDNKIKIWEENNNQYKNIITLYHSKHINSILLLEDKNILISSGLDGTKFWDINNNYQEIFHFKDIFSGWNNALERIGDDKIIVQEISYNLKIITISTQKIINEIKLDFQIIGIKSIENKGIFLIGGNSKDIKIYRGDNYELIQTIKNAHDENIYGFIELKNNSIVSYSDDKTIKIWSL